MKKSFTMLCAAILAAFTASAVTPEISTDSYNFGTFKATRASAPSKAPAANMEELIGEYVCICYDYKTENNDRIDFPITVRQGETENEVILNGVAGIPLDIVGTVEFTEDGGVITVPNQFLKGGKLYDEYDVWLQHGAWVEDENGNTISGITELPFNVLIVDGGLLFGYPNDIIQMDAYVNETYVENLCAVSYIVASPVYVDPFTYEPIEGKATFYDGWILPGFGIDQMEHPLEVAVERCIENPNQYRIVEPYADDIFSDHNEGTEDAGYIVFDASHNRCVLALTGYKSGFYERATWGMGNFYFYNLEGLLHTDYQLLGQDVSTEEIKNLMISRGYETSTMVDNVVTFKNCLFGYDQNPMAGGNWKINDEYVVMTATLVFPEGFNSVTGIEIDHNAPVEYYNLQGIKVANPENGVYIRYQDKKAEKVFIP